MDQRYNYNDPWQRGVYETGRTRPPKSHGGVIALLLVLVILLLGIVSVLGVLNVHLFAQLSGQPQDPDVAFHVSSLDGANGTDDTDGSEPSAHGDEPGDSTGATEAAGSADPQVELQESPLSVDNITQSGAMSLQEIYAKNINSVVSISCSLPSGSSTGTGVIMSKDGYIVTNCHVVEDALSVSVRLTDERVFPASLVGSDAVSDLAVLLIEADGLQAAEFGDSSVLRVGDSVAAIGDPLGVEFRGTMTDGIVSAINRDVTTGGRTLTLIQTNAALNSGNSGGPLINCYGQVIGINTLKIGAFTDSAGVEGLGFAIPSTTVKEIVDQLIHQGYVSGRPSLGLSGESVSTFYQYYYRMPAGLYINAVEENSPADEIGIEAGDILVSVGDTRITGPDDVNTVLYNYQVGDTVNIVIYRSGRQYSATLTLTESKG
ncbi:MAG: trypsin-like peptidase domain-containing protein [Oscillospiraceae bacterium]|nr:trypsin-like peptidase domain-containing protein [Oscillospiraceae bacterium]